MKKKFDAFFCEWEADHDVGGKHIPGGCITFPLTIEVEDDPVFGSSVQITVYNVDSDGNHKTLYNPDLTGGELQIPEEYFDVVPILEQHGYDVCKRPVDKEWLECWERGFDLGEIDEEYHWHWQARIVQF